MLLLECIICIIYFTSSDMNDIPQDLAFVGVNNLPVMGGGGEVLYLHYVWVL